MTSQETVKIPLTQFIEGALDASRHLEAAANNEVGYVPYELGSWQYAANSAVIEISNCLKLRMGTYDPATWKENREALTMLENIVRWFNIELVGIEQ